jgi:hypothetical protein
VKDGRKAEQAKRADPVFKPIEHVLSPDVGSSIAKDDC